MNCNYAKKIYSQPPSYEENIKERQFKRKTYAYFNVPEKQQEKTEVDDQRQSLHRDFSFQNIRSRITQQDRNQKQLLPHHKSTFQQSIEQDCSSKPTHKRQNSKKRQFSLHATNINTINDKIADLLNLVNKGKKQVKEEGQSYQDKQYTAVDFVPFGSKCQNQQNINMDTSPFDNVNIDGKQVQKSSRWMEMTPTLAQIDNRIHQKLKKRLSKYNKEEKVTSTRPILYDQPRYPDKFDFDNNKKQKIKEVHNNNELLNDFSLRNYQEGLKSRISGEQCVPLQKIKEKTRLSNRNANPVPSDRQLRSKKDPLINFNIFNKERRETITVKNRELDSKIKQISNQIMQRSLIRQKEKDTNFFPSQKESAKLQNMPSHHGQESAKPTILRMAQKMSELIDIEIQFRNLRQLFESNSDPSKWESLNKQFNAKGIYLENEQLKKVIAVSIHQKNPFKNKIGPFPITGVKDLARLYYTVEQFWIQDLNKCVSSNYLNQQGFEMAYIDLNKKGSISIEDMVCFVNVNTHKFYRSRDLATIFHRFLKLQGKSLDKNIADGVQYSTFMGKLTK